MSEISPTRLPARFRLLWAATAVSNLGDGVRATALPLLATELTRDPRLIAGVAVAERLPWLIFILPGGAWADRHDRRRLRVLLDLTRALVVGALALAVALDMTSIVAVYLAAATMAAAESIVDSSSMALVPSLVDGRDLERAGGRLTGAELVAGSLVGPPLGGLLFAGAVAIPFGFDAATFVLAAILASLIPGTFRPRRAGPPTRSIRHEIADGMRWLWRDRTIRSLALISTGLGTMGYVSGGVLVLFAREELGLDSVGYGVLLIPPAVGGVIGSIVAPRIRHVRLGPVLAATVLIDALTSFAIAASHRTAFVAVSLSLQSGAIIVWNVLTLALRQRVVPDHLLGRVGASYRFLVYVGMPFGALAGGLLANAVGVRPTFVVTGIASLVLAAVVLASVRDAPRTPG